MYENKLTQQSRLGHRHVNSRVDASEAAVAVVAMKLRAAALGIVLATAELRQAKARRRRSGELATDIAYGLARNR